MSSKLKSGRKANGLRFVMSNSHHLFQIMMNSLTEVMVSNGKQISTIAVYAI